MKAEFVREWLADARKSPEEGQDTQRWDKYVELITHIFETGELPQEIPWSLLVLLPKPDGGTRGIGLLELAWKHVEAIIDTRVKKVIRYHDSMHGFTSRRGTGTAMVEAKLQQEHASIHQEPLFQVFLDLKKAYDSLDQPRALDTLKNYGMGDRLLTLIRNYWSQQQIVTRQSGFHGPIFTATRGGTQGGLFTPTLFNICVDNVIRYWLSLVVEDKQVSTQGFGTAVANQMALFYADDGLISSTDPTWLQQALDVLTGLFRRIGLSTNAAKTKMMTCYPGSITTRLSPQAYTRRMTGQGNTFRQRQRLRVTCPVDSCRKELNQGSMKTHLRRVHGLEDDSWQDDLTTPPPPSRAYRLSFPRTTTFRSCPVPGCLGRAKTRAGLRAHFQRLHPQDTVCILEEGSVPLPRCQQCDMHVSQLALNRGHTNTAQCRKGAELLHRRRLQETIRKANEVVLSTNGTPLEKVTAFCYLGRIVAGNNSDWPAVYKNLQKAKAKWALISRPLLKTGVAPRFVGMFYKAIVQAVLLYGCETWVITPDILRLLESFHHRVARRISHKMPYLVNGTWIYPPIEDALAEAGLFPLEIYIRRRQNSIAQYVATRPIHALCRTATPAPETPTETPPEGDALPSRSRLYRYWTQPLMTTPMPPLPTRPTPSATPTATTAPQPPAPGPQLPSDPPAPTGTTAANTTPTVETVDEESTSEDDAEDEVDTPTANANTTTSTRSTPAKQPRTNRRLFVTPTPPPSGNGTATTCATTASLSPRGSAPGPDDDPGPPPPRPSRGQAPQDRQRPAPSTPGLVTTHGSSESTISSLTQSTSTATSPFSLPRPPSCRAFTPTEWELIQAALSPQGEASDELSQVGTIPLTRHSFRSLTPRVWLNDEVINGHILLYCQWEALQARLQQVPNSHGHVFSSFFFSLLLQVHHPDPQEQHQYNYERVRSWGNRTPGHNIFLLKTLLIPVHITNNHWACICIDFPRRTVTYLDSAHTDDRAVRYTGATLQYLHDEHLHRVRRPLPTALWSVTTMDPPQQDNGFDCGVFCCTFIEYILQEKPWDFDARHTTYLRYRMTLTLLRQHLMD